MRSCPVYKTGNRDALSLLCRCGGGEAEGGERNEMSNTAQQIYKEDIEFRHEWGEWIA